MSQNKSLTRMGKVLVGDAIPDDCGLAIEYTIPQIDRRVDFLLPGKSVVAANLLVRLNDSAPFIYAAAGELGMPSVQSI